MKLKAYQVVFPSALVVVMVSFLSIFILAGANPSFAAEARKKPPTVAKTSAVEHAEAQIKELRGALNITKAQEPLWDSLTQVMRDNSKEMDAFIKERAESTKDMDAVERMKFHIQTTESHLNQMKKLIPPFEALYVSMTDAQKIVADTMFRTGKRGKHKVK